MTKAIESNLRGLANFFCLFAQAFLFPRRERPSPRLTKFIENSTEYDNLVGSSLEVIGGLEPVFCPMCHVLAVQIRQTNQGTELFQNGKRLITMGGNIIIGKNGKKQTGFPVSCPKGHSVMIPQPVKESI